MNTNRDVFAFILCGMLTSGCAGLQQAARPAIQLPASKSEAPPRAIALSPNGSCAVIARGRYGAMLQDPEPGDAYVVSLQAGAVERELPSARDGNSSVVILSGKPSPFVVVASYDGTVLLADMNGQGRTVRVELAAGPIVALAAGTQGQSFIAACCSRESHGNVGKLLVCGRDGRILTEIGTGPVYIGHIACSREGGTIAASLVSGSVTVCELPTGRRRTLDLPDDQVCTDLAFASDGRLILCGGYRVRGRNADGWLSVYDLQRAQWSRSVALTEEPASLAVRGRIISLIVGASHRLQVMSAPGLTRIKTGALANVAAAAIDDKGDKIVCLTRAGEIRVISIDGEQ